jgi:hypothetical protein
MGLKDIVLPPALFYGVGAVLIVFGALRAYMLGWRQRPHAAVKTVPDPEAYGEPPASETPVSEPAETAPTQQEDRAAGWSPAAGGSYKRHITFGILWVVMGLFLLITTILNTK